MSSAGTRERLLPLSGSLPTVNVKPGGSTPSGPVTLANGKQMTVSESHPINRKTGGYDAGGPFFTTRVSYFSKPGHMENAWYNSQESWFTGDAVLDFPSVTDMESVGFKALNPKTKLVDLGTKPDLTKLGTDAISYVSPTNPASNLGTGLAEVYREGFPTLPGIQLWRSKTAKLKALGSEYLNYQFGWAPLSHEVHEVANAAKLHSTIMSNYHKGEGKDTHRRFDYPSQSFQAEVSKGGTGILGLHPSFYTFPPGESGRIVSLVRETKSWFVGSFTYALPSSTDSWRKGLGFGSDADQVLGIALTPDILWELTPWSWAVDWFSNAGEVINNVTNFGLAGLVLRYGYIMSETTERVTNTSPGWLYDRNPKHIFRNPFNEKPQIVSTGPSSSGIEVVTKTRSEASPFGFSVGWEGLSPTQLAITAALGITRLL